MGTKPNPGEVLQLIVARTYTTPTAVGCDLKEEAHNHILASIDDVSGAVVSPTSKVDPGVGDANAANATVVLAPGEKVQITLRGNVTLARMAEIGATLAPRPVAQRTPIGGTGGTTTYAQYAPRGATTTALSYDGSAVFTATVKDAALAAVTSGSVNFVAAGNVFLGTVAAGRDGHGVVHAGRAAVRLHRGGVLQRLERVPAQPGVAHDDGLRRDRLSRDRDAGARRAADVRGHRDPAPSTRT